MYDKDFAELVKIAAEKLKEDTVYKMLTRSEDYQKESDERDKAERNYEQLDLTMEQRKVCDVFLDYRDRQSLEYSDYSYLTNSSSTLVSRLDICLKKQIPQKPEIWEDDFEGDGRKFYTDGPYVHEYLKELVRDTGIEDYVTVGEMSSTTLEHCIRYSGAEEKELSMCFNFHHLKVDYKDGNKWELMEPDYMELKVIFEKWQMGMQRGNAWNALFWCNHDQPRIVSRFGNEGEYWKESAKMLAGMIHLMRGTPYIYQGEEIGMTNPHYTSIEQYADVESRNYYEILLNEGKTKEEALEILAARSRDNSRTPMQWTDERYCGFSDTKPWIPVSDNFEKINVKKQKQDRDSILEFYKKLIMLRKEKEVIARGNIEFMEVENDGVLAYTRCLDKQKLLVCCNFRDVESQMEFTQEWKSGRKILGNYEENHKNNYKVLTLRPYEIIVLEKGEE